MSDDKTQTLKPVGELDQRLVAMRDSVCVAMPSIWRFLDIGTVAGMMQCLPYYKEPFFLLGMSNISLARNEIANRFMQRTKYEWIQWIDADICFTLRDWELLWEGDETIVAAEYAKKIVGEKPSTFGMGFCRVHRSVYEKIDAMTNDDGSEFAQRFYHKGMMMVDYHPSGVGGQSRWLSEDHSFFSFASMTDAKPRNETRTRLKHVGFFEYNYPNQIPGYEIINDDSAVQ